MAEQGLPTPPLTSQPDSTPALSSEPSVSDSQITATAPTASAQDPSNPPSTSTEAPIASSVPSGQVPPATIAPSQLSTGFSASTGGAGSNSSILIVDQVVQQVANANNLQALWTDLGNIVSGKDAALCEMLSDGQDPLIVLGNMADSAPGWTLAVMYILPARLWFSATAPPVPMSYIAEFCRRFDPVQMRMVAERVTPLARGIVYRAEALGSVKLAIPLLFDLLTRYAPSLNYLTTIHQTFLTACVESKSFTAALPVLSVPITEISNTPGPSLYSTTIPDPATAASLAQFPVSPDLTYVDHLVYHYLGGVALAALKKFTLAEEFFEICASAPVGSSTGRERGPGGQGGNGGAGGSGGADGGRGGGGRAGGGMRLGGQGMSYMPEVRGGHPAEASWVQVDAMKKLVLVQLILYGQSKPPPRYTHPSITNTIRNSPYGALAKAYLGPTSALMQIAQKEAGTFEKDQNFGLVKQALARIPRWAIKKLTETYLTLGLREIGAEVGVGVPNAYDFGGQGEGSGFGKETKWKPEDVDVEVVRGVMLDMIAHKEINASISADDTVTFDDDVPLQVSKTDVDRALAEAQRQAAILRELEGTLGRSKEWLSKAIRSRDEHPSMGMMGGMGLQDDDLMAGIMGSGGTVGSWDEPAAF